MKALTEEELRRLLAEIPSEWRLFFEFLAHTGLRIGEAIALRWSDVDLGQRRLLVRRRLYRGAFAPRKSKYGRRDVPLSTGRLAHSGRFGASGGRTRRTSCSRPTPAA